MRVDTDRTTYHVLKGFLCRDEAVEGYDGDYLLELRNVGDGLCEAVGVRSDLIPLLDLTQGVAPSGLDKNVQSCGLPHRKCDFMTVDLDTAKLVLVVSFVRCSAKLICLS